MPGFRKPFTGASRAAGTAFAVALVMLAAPAGAADNQTPNGDAHASGKVVVQSVGPGVPVSLKTPPLKLTDHQRARIQQALLTAHTETSFQVKSNKSAESFEPKLDEAIPKGLHGAAFPQPLITEMPQLKRYTYLKFKGQVLIVDPMTHKIVDVFPEQG